MPLDPSSLVLPVLEWVREKILGFLKPMRVDYNEAILKIELLPWTQMPALLGALLLVVALVNIFTESWTFLFVVVFFGGGATVLASWALRKIRTIIVANKPQEWIRVARHGPLNTNLKPGTRNYKQFSVKNLKAITYEPVPSTMTYDDSSGRTSYGRMFNICVMTGEGSTNILENEGEDEAAVIVGYLNGFLFDEDEEMESKESAQEK